MSLDERIMYMNYKEARLELGGMRKIEIVNYFQDIASMNSNSCMEGNKSLDEDIKMRITTIKAEEWEVEISPERVVALGSISIPSTILFFRSKEKLFDSMLADFRLKFLSAGG